MWEYFDIPWSNWGWNNFGVVIKHKYFLMRYNLLPTPKAPNQVHQEITWLIKSIVPGSFTKLNSSQTRNQQFNSLKSNSSGLANFQLNLWIFLKKKHYKQVLNNNTKKSTNPQKVAKIQCQSNIFAQFDC